MYRIINAETIDEAGRYERLKEHVFYFIALLNKNSSTYSYKQSLDSSTLYKLLDPIFGGFLRQQSYQKIVQMLHKCKSTSVILFH